MRQSGGATVPGYHVWEAPGKPISIYISLDVVDRISQEVQRAFSAVRKRGAEVGGLLLGTAVAGERLIIRIEDFEQVQCVYKFGPSYILSEEDQQEFEQAYSRHSRSGDPSVYNVGYFRSHTRAGLSLGPEDAALCRQFFSHPTDVVLLIKPFSTQVSTAGFLFYENGKLQDEPYVKFPFRRRALESREAPSRGVARAPSPEGMPAGRRPPESAPYQDSEWVQDAPAIQYDEPSPANPYPQPNLTAAEMEEPRFADSRYTEPRFTEPRYDQPRLTEPGRSRFRGGWVWIPLALIFLLAGVLLGFQVALKINPKSALTGTQAFSLGLAVTKNEDNLHVTWDRQAPAIRASSRGVLEIVDGNYKKGIDLDSSQLENGSVIYRHLADDVVFQLVVYMNDKTSMSETLLWKAGE
ncbi:MAG TPA: hypothetical protein VKV15_10330 [Bryobacteraceae bacterium]|nr:hypothetical protein [Bryobacteraceae bacterium]